MDNDGDPRCLIMAHHELAAAFEVQESKRKATEVAKNAPLEASAAAVAAAAKVRAECDHSSYAAQLASSQARQHDHNPVAMQQPQHQQSTAQPQLAQQTQSRQEQQSKGKQSAAEQSEIEASV